MHPFESITPDRRAILFRRFLIATFAIQIVLIISGARLQNSVAPNGIISYEFAGTPEHVAAMLDSWQGAWTALQTNLWVDYLFMVAYSCTIALGCVWAKYVLRGRGWPLSGVGTGLAWGQWLAAGLDAIENAGLIYFTFAKAADPWPAIVWWCAAIKFALVGAGILYTAFGLAARLSRRSAA